MKRFFVGLVLLHALSWGEQAVYAQVLDMVNSKYTFGPIKGFTAVLSLLLAPDKEAAAVFAALGYYPMVKPRLERRKWPWLWKGLLFNAVILALYWLLIHLLGMDALAEEFADAGRVMTVVMLLLGNVTFLLLDMVLIKRFRR